MAEHLFARVEHLVEYQVDRQVDRKFDQKVDRQVGWAAAELEHQGEHMLLKHRQKEAGVQLLLGMVALDQVDRQFQSIG